ncbi:alpha-amylase family glycosyl hydrolase [Solirubrobacter ginsenosidimutans]|uniref:Alpha-amylase family glycosyl hydrolase n=1 Tax=Solirubrobacter ginsenosidimutans TaxID=490573 RepID=A0A9X3MYS3_9ACTN|nr:alpha-amylase family glycosyl hydrolase [Solirubrobacter ginsenosidimutans]MDA0165265.1 alpha-amylase family glycosyl hydrolase [Solirubrobacter ginsenosidimutans]
MSEPAWWQRGAIYQIYPRSFADANGDGVGDLAGIAAHLDHLQALAVEAIWLSPIFTSPMADFGYDVADYCDVDPVFGTLADLDALIAACHARDIKLVLDWVPNHSSDQHPWFKESRSSRENPKRDWYTWRDGKDGGPPNDWESVFKACGPAWTLDETTGQYYLHSFMPEQPDLNWENPEVVAAMHDTLRFWMDRGVDGLRLDAIAKIAKDPLLRDQEGASRRHDEDWESIHEHLRGIRRVIDEYDDRMLVGEVALQDLHRVVGYLESGDQLHLAHNFVFIDQAWDADTYATSIADFEALAEEAAWPAWFLSNHDNPRPATRFDHDGLGAQRARAILVMLYALRGTPFIFQGEELGLPNATIPADRIVDVDGRDPERAPIPWTPEAPGHGFTTAADAWLPFVDDALTLNAQTQAEDPDSTLQLARAIARLRAKSPTLQTGAQQPYDAGPDILAWTREGEDERLLVAVNFSDRELPLQVEGELVLSSDPGRNAVSASLAPSEALILRLAT